MPKRFFFLFILTISLTLNAQTFTDIKAGLTGVSESANCWIDYNEDGLPDIFVTGDFYSGNAHGIYSKLYRNQKNDHFTEVSTNVVNVFRGDLDWADYNLDGITDLFMIGETSAGLKIARFTKITAPAVFSMFP